MCVVPLSRALMVNVHSQTNKFPEKQFPACLGVFIPLHIALHFYTSTGLPSCYSDITLNGEVWPLSDTQT